MDEIRTRFNPEDGFEKAQQFYNRSVEDVFNAVEWRSFVLFF